MSLLFLCMHMHMHMKLVGDNEKGVHVQEKKTRQHSEINF